MGHTSAVDAFLTVHRQQLVSSGIPECYWATLNEKIQNQIFNAGETFQLLQIDYEEARKPHEPAWGLQAIKPLNLNDPKQIYLIDHAWTFRVGHAKAQLLQFDALRERLCNILGVPLKPDKVESAEQIFDNIWKVCNTYSIGNAENVEDQLPVWYVMDEIGSAVMHSDTPNCRIVPFVHVNSQITYSVLFPIKEIEIEEFIFRDYAEGIKGENRRAALLPWKPHTFNVGFDPVAPGPEYYLSGHVEESLPNLKNLEKAPAKKDTYKVYAEYSLIRDYLKSPRFELIDDVHQADILWFTRHFKDFFGLSETPHKFVNQFPFEYVLTIKDLFSLTCRRSEKKSWFPLTYNLATEIENFVAYFQRENSSEDNYWIIKPYNLARSLDTHITNNLDYIMRLPATGPKIAQKYITSPVLFHRPECGSVKFDLRYVILVKSFKPLEAFVYNEFFLRFANKPFELKDFHVYEKHFTVMNYEEGAALKRMLCSDFKAEWGVQHPRAAWGDVEKDILEMLKDVLESAVKAEPPCGVAHSPQSRALYAADIMLEWTETREVQPKILEVNWTPDCKRACEYYPEFYNDVFKLLFLDDEASGAFTRL